MKQKTDEFYFKKAQDLASRGSTCLKIQTGVVLVKEGRVVGQGVNLCSPGGFRHGRKVKKCLRLGVPSGTGYELCQSIHAEVTAVAGARPADLRGATLYLSGHYYPCWHCEGLARLVGIKKIKVKDSKARAFYTKKQK